jgi:hypothetical protein
MGMEAYCFGKSDAGGSNIVALPVAWLGLRCQQITLAQLNQNCLRPFTARELQQLEGLLDKPFIKDKPLYYTEIKAMKEFGHSVELQALNWYAWYLLV